MKEAKQTGTISISCPHNILYTLYKEKNIHIQTTHSILYYSRTVSFIYVENVMSVSLYYVSQEEQSLAFIFKSP
jgi:hypothetical protein